MINIILCGGSGTRLWPLSRKLLPKQFIKLFNNKSLFQLTIERNKNLCKRSLIVVNENQYFLALDQVEEIVTNYSIDNTNFLLEPVGKNTAPAIALSCFNLDEDDIVLVTPSDHLIKNQEGYEKVVKRAKELAQENYLVTFGIKPTHPHTGYGYIEYEVKEANQLIFDVKKFHEKPDINTAKKYLNKNTINNALPTTHYSWNSGMFCFKAGVFLEELKKYSPEIYEASKEAFKKAKKENYLVRINYEYMEKIKEDSIDYAVMEKSKKIKVVSADIEWSDLGNFDSLAKELETNRDNLIEIDSKNNLVISEKEIALIDIEDLIVVDTKDALLISKKGSSEKVKNVVNILKTKKPELTKYHTKVYRPWGSYEILAEGKGYKVKRIVVKPGKRLSLQKHFHRSEHWIVVSGIALVQVGEKEFILRENESTYIKQGEIHRLSNPGKIDVVLIEAQIGDYLGEDDIVRIEDDFNRS